MKLKAGGSAEVRVTGAADPPPVTLPEGLGVDERQLLDMTHDGLWVIEPRRSQWLP